MGARDRRLAWLLAGTAAITLTALSLLLVPWSGQTGGVAPAAVDSVFTPAEVARAEEYSSAVRLLSWAVTAGSLALAAALGLTRGGSALLRRVAGRLPWWAAVPLGALVLVVLGRVATSPLRLLIRQRRLEERLTTQPLAGWLSDQALSALVTSAVAAVLVLLVVACARRWPRRWFVGAGLGAAGATFAVSMAYPLVVEPLFNEFRAMPSGPLRDSLIALAAEEGVQVDDVLVADASRRTTSLNAYVSGIGGTRRIVVYDTLLAELPAAQVRSVAAHEVAHARDHDVVLGTALGAVGAFGGMCLLALLLDSAALRRRTGVTGPGDPRVTALVLALVAAGGLLAAPVQNAVSRALETRADRVALEVTGDPDAFRQLQRQLALKSLADPTPPRWAHLWFGTHPTVLERVGAADAFARRSRSSAGVP